MLTAMIPFLTWVLLGVLVFARSRLMLTLREGLLVSVTICSGWLVLGIELLSLLHAIRFWPVMWWWGVPLVILAVLVGWEVRRGKRVIPAWPKLKIVDWVLLLAIVFILGWSFCQAAFSPPNNVDSQEYHLQRQVFWMQQGSVESYSTNNPRQIVMPPLSEYAGLTLMVLTGNDRYHNLAQWVAFVLAMFAVSLTTRRFNSSATAQLLTALWVATIPLAFLQASTTKNDVVVMMWICLLVYWVLLLNSRSRLRWAHVVLLGLAFGAVSMTKGTGMIFAMPLAGLVGIFLIGRHWRRAVPALGLIAVIALAMNAGAFGRNYRLFGTIAPDTPGIHGKSTVGNEDHSLGALASNMLRAAGSHLESPSERLNDWFTAQMRSIHEKMGRDINDPLTTWMPGGQFRPYKWAQDDEDKAAAPAHMLLVLLLPILLLVTWRHMPRKDVVSILLVFIGGFVLFSLLLKWQNWHVRLIITLPAMVAPIFAWVFSAPRIRYVALVPAVFLFVTLTASLNCIPRPLLGPKSIFHADPLALRCYYHPNWADDYRQLAERMDRVRPKIVGFYTPVYSPDYPMQRLLLDRNVPPPVFTSFNGAVQIPGRAEPDPDALLVAGPNPARLKHDATGTWYRRDAHVGRYTLMFKE